MIYLSAILIGVLYALLMSLIHEPHRRRFNAIMVAGAGAAYLSGGGFGGWEFLFAAVATYIAYRGLESWTFIGIAWLMHTAWDLLHHFKGNPIMPFYHDSSLGCAICDPVIALWCLRGGPSLISLVRGKTARPHTVDHAPPTLGRERIRASPVRLGHRRRQRRAGPAHAEPGEGRPG